MISFFEIWVSLKYLFPTTRDRFFSLITLFSFLGIALGVATLIIVMSVMNGFREELTSKILGINGHLKVQTINNQKIHEHQKISNLLKNNVENIKISKVVTSQGLLTFRKFSSGVLLKGVDSQFFEKRKIFKGKIDKISLQSFKNNDGIFVGKKLKERLGLEPGDFISIISPDGYETILGNIPRSSNFKVVGFFDTGMYEYDMSLVIFPIKTIQDFLNVGQKIDFLEIESNNFKNIEITKSEIQKIIPKYFKTIDWRELNPSLFNAINVEKNVMFLILLLIIIVAIFNLISSMIILVSNKKRDIGVLRVLGVSKKKIMKIFIINGFSIGFCGTLLGLILGLLFCFNINRIKEFIEIFLDSNLFSEEIYFFSKLPMILDSNQIISIITISLLLSFLATIYPSWRATKIEPVNLIKWD